MRGSAELRDDAQDGLPKDRADGRALHRADAADDEGQGGPALTRAGYRSLAAADAGTHSFSSAWTLDACIMTCFGIQH
eukprot:4416122-Pleurochrysis_carterae.AAC.1